MLRMTLLLCCGLFLTLLIAGQDNGQIRLGLANGTPPPVLPVAVVAQRPAAGTVAEVAATPVAFAVEPPAPVAALATAEPEPEALPVRYVTASSLNVRDGPSTRFAVVGKLTRGEAALVVWTETNGWSRIRIEGDGIEGYVSSKLLTDAPVN